MAGCPDLKSHPEVLADGFQSGEDIRTLIVRNANRECPLL
jgi:hypothetical protein